MYAQWESLQACTLSRGQISYRICKYRLEVSPRHLSRLTNAILLDRIAAASYISALSKYHIILINICFIRQSKKVCYVFRCDL